MSQWKSDSFWAVQKCAVYFWRFRDFYLSLCYLILVCLCLVRKYALYNFSLWKFIQACFVA